MVSRARSSVGRQSAALLRSERVEAAWSPTLADRLKLCCRSQSSKERTSKPAERRVLGPPPLVDDTSAYDHRLLHVDKFVQTRAPTEQCKLCLVLVESEPTGGAPVADDPVVQSRSRPLTSSAPSSGVMAYAYLSSANKWWLMLRRPKTDATLSVYVMNSTGPIVNCPVAHCSLHGEFLNFSVYLERLRQVLEVGLKPS